MLHRNLNLNYKTFVTLFQKSSTHLSLGRRGSLGGSNISIGTPPSALLFSSIGITTLQIRIKVRVKIDAKVNDKAKLRFRDLY